MKRAHIRLGGTARTPDDVRFLHRLGLSFAEVPIQNLPVFMNLVEDFQEVKDTLGMDYVCHGPQEGDPNDRGNLEGSYLPGVMALFPLMDRLEMDLLTIHLWLDPRFVRKEILEYKKTFLRRVLEEAASKGITLCIENLSERADHLERYFRELPDLNLTLDVGHGQLLTDRNTGYEFIKQWPERIRHVHLHDNRGGDSHLDDLHLPPGEGNIDLKDILEKLRLQGYDRTVTLELKPFEIEGCLHRVKGMLW